jgi:hypothetical protein
MRESERIRLEAAADTDDNDMRDINYLRKIERAERKESFEDCVLPVLRKKYNIIQKDTQFDILTNKYGKLLFYPKANSLLICKDNYWIKKRGLKWIQKNLL